MEISHKGKVVVITGGSSGIGKSMVEQFQSSGAMVCNLDINAADKDDAFYKTDVSSQVRMIEVMKEIVIKYGQVDILINNAGIAHIGNIENTTEEELDRIYQVNIKGVYNGIYAAIPHMKQKKHGVILNVASIASEVGLPDRFAYSLSKAAVENMTYTVARDYLHFGIRCNCISPGRVHTPFVDHFIAKNYPGEEKEIFEKLSKSQPIGRMGKSEEIAKLVVYLCSEEASFITGSNFPIDGGFVKLNT